jgi:hypothetical protein
MSRCDAVIALLVSATAFPLPATPGATGPGGGVRPALGAVATSPAQGQAPVSPVCRSTPGETGAARAYDQLTEDQRRVFDDGGQVFVRRDIAGLPWPAVDVYQYIDARPEQAAAVFFDYGLHRTYIPGVRQSRVSAIVDPLTVEVDYVVSVPVVSDERYTGPSSAASRRSRPPIERSWRNRSEHSARRSSRSDPSRRTRGSSPV